MKSNLRHPDWPAAVLGITLSVAICFPFATSGRLLLLDWSLGPHVPLAPLQAYGLNGGLTSGVAGVFAVDVLMKTLGSLGTWLVGVAVFPVAAASISRLVGGSPWARLGAASLYCVNPFIFERVFVGHFELLFGYALMPLGVASALKFFDSPQWWMPIPALWWAFLTALSPHFAWIYGVIFLTAFFTRHPLRASTLARALVVSTIFTVMSLYIVLPHAATQLQLSTRTSSDLSLYRTSGDPHFGLFGNVLGLYGFWRVGPELPKNVFSGWPLLLIAIMVVAGVGTLQNLRRETRSHYEPAAAGRKGAAALLAIGIAGYFLALGDQGPTGPLFRWAYFHVPFFAVMREPEKFLMLTALAYAVLFGLGVEHLMGARRRLRLGWKTACAAGFAVLLPLAYTPTIFDGLAGQIRLSHLPASWASADHVMGNGSGQILFLPWHLYEAFPFTGGQVIGNPAPTSFTRSVISGDNVEAGGTESTSTSPRSAYLQRIYAQGPALRNFGGLVSPLGVEYVVLAKTVDWRSYYWLNLQTDLVPVINSGGLELWRNAAYSGVGQASNPRQIRQISPVAYSIGAGAPGDVTLDAVFQRGWQLGTQKAQETPQGTIRFKVGRLGGIVRFAPWGITRLGYIISGAAFVALLGVVVGDRLWRGGRNQRRKGLNAKAADGDPLPPG